jgi:hypothetical protein
MDNNNSLLQLISTTGTVSEISFYVKKNASLPTLKFDAIRLLKTIHKCFQIISANKLEMF